MEGDLMRKFLKVTAIVGLALLVAAPAMALDFKFGAEYRVRFYSNLNGQQATLGQDEGTTSQRGAQVRIRPRFDVSDDNGNITATLRLEIGDIEFGNGGGAAGTANGGSNGTIGYSSARIGNGSGGAIDGDGVNVETKWAYMDFATPWGVPLRWRAGIQPWYESKGMIVDTDLAGVRAYGKSGIASYEVGWYRANGGPCTNTAAPATFPTGGATACSTAVTTDNNFDFYEAKVGANFAKWLNPTLYYIYGYNAATNTTSNANVYYQTKPATSQFFGLATTGDFGFLRYDLDFIFGTQNGGAQGNYTAGGGGGDGRMLTQGWAADGGVHIPVGPLLFHVVGSYATGDKQNGGNSEAMPWIAPGWSGAGGLYEIVGGGGAFDAVDVTQDFPAGLWMMGFGAEYRPVKALWLRAMYGYAGFTSKRSNCAYNNGKVLGACYGASYQGKGYTAPTVVGGVVTAGGEGGMAGEATLGHEIGLRADYDVWTNFKIQGAAAWLLVPTGSTVQEYILQLLYNF